MPDHITNIGILKDFVQANELRNRHSHVRFYCNVNIKTDVTDVNLDCEAMITFDGYNDEGVVTLLGHDLDPYTFPTVFRAKYQNFRTAGSELKIWDTHPSDKIGKYEVTILAGDRLSE